MSANTVTKAVRNQILRCHREGWSVANTASIVKVKPQVVEQVLSQAGVN